MKNDITSKEDIKLLVDRFYEKVIADPQLGHIFTDVFKVHWEKHLPVMYDFWDNAIFFTGSYHGNPMQVHAHVNRIFPLQPSDFDQWIVLFLETIHELFEGPKAFLAKERSISIAKVMQLKLLQQDTKNANPKD
jgi:hemoglobin